MRILYSAISLSVPILYANAPCFAGNPHDLGMHFQADMAQRESWVTHAGFPPSYRIDETAKVLLIDLDAAQLSRSDEDAVLDDLLKGATSDVQKAAIKVVRAQINHDR